MANQEVGNLAVKVSMDSTGFQNGISGINTQLKVVQSSFKAASAQLGSFGSSTDQIKLKADSLNQQMVLQQQKVDSLTSAFNKSVEMKGADAKATQNLEIKLNLARAALSNMENDLRDTNEQIRLQESGWTKLGDSLNNVSGKFKGVGEKLSTVGETLSKTISAPILGAGAAAVKFAGDFEESANKVATIADTQAMSMEEIKKGVLELSNTVNIGATELNNALYQVISATGDTSNALSYVEIASKAAIGGFTDTTTAIDGLTSVMNAYGLKGKEAMQTLSDQMLVAQNYGKTTFAEISSGIGNVIPIAASLNVKTQELFASIAVLTKNGIATSAGITGLKAALSNIIKPSGEAVDISSQLGIEFNAAHLKSVGWANFLSEIGAKTKGNTETMAKLFGSVEALNTVTVLATTGSKDFAGALQAMGQTGGATEKAFETMNQGVNDGIDGMLNSLKNLAISMGQILAPTVNELIGKVQEMITWFSGLSDTQKETIVKFAAIAVVIGPVVLIIGKLFTAISIITGAFSAASGAIAAAGGIIAVLTSPIGIAIAAIVLLAGAAYLIIKNWEPIKAFFKNLWDGIVNVTSTALNGLINWFKELPQKLYDLAVTMFTYMKNGVVNTVTRVKDAIVTGISTAISWIKGLPGEALQWGKDMIQGFINGIKSMMSSVTNAISNVGSTIRSYLHFSTPDQGPLADYETWMPDFMGGLAQGIERNKSLVKNAISNLSNDMKFNVSANLVPSMAGATAGKGSTVNNSYSYGALLRTDKIVIANDMDVQSLANKLEFYREQMAKAKGSN